ncbi:MAG: hypothetical protein LBQ27_03320 [Clostridiales bacterium]|nr:hypothetical protein [Clostridiales bacterium]
MTTIKVKQPVRCGAPMCKNHAEYSFGNPKAVTANRLFLCGTCIGAFKTELDKIFDEKSAADSKNK